MNTLPRIAAIALAVLLLGGGASFAADRGRGRDDSEAQWYADPQRGWIRTDKHRDRKQDERRETPKDRRSKQRDRDEGKGKKRGSDY
jgi:hypothetical protein